MLQHSLKVLPKEPFKICQKMLINTWPSKSSEHVVWPVCSVWLKHRLNLMHTSWLLKVDSSCKLGLQKWFNITARYYSWHDIIAWIVTQGVTVEESITIQMQQVPSLPWNGNLLLGVCDTKFRMGLHQTIVSITKKYWKPLDMFASTEESELNTIMWK